MQKFCLCYTSVVLFTNWLVNEELIKSCYLFWIIYPINIHQNTHPNTHTPKYIHKNTCRGYNIVTYPQKSALFPTYFVSFLFLPSCLVTNVTCITSCLLYPSLVLALALHLNHEQLFKNSNYTNCSCWRRSWQVYVTLGASVGVKTTYNGPVTLWYTLVD